METKSTIPAPKKVGIVLILLFVENILKTSRGKTVYLPIIKPELSSICFQFADYPYTADYVKTSQETYFGVKIILVDKTIKQ